MWVDPIVQEVRNAGEELARQANYDLHIFFQNLRDNEKKRGSQVVSRYVPVTYELDQTDASSMEK